MAVNEIVLVANGNGHRHVVVRWGHGLLGERERDTDRSLIRLKIRAIAVGEETETRNGHRKRKRERSTPGTQRNLKLSIVKVVKHKRNKTSQVQKYKWTTNNRQPCVDEWYREQT